MAAVTTVTPSPVTGDNDDDPPATIPFSSVQREEEVNGVGSTVTAVTRHQRRLIVRRHRRHRKPPTSALRIGVHRFAFLGTLTTATGEQSPSGVLVW